MRTSRSESMTGKTVLVTGSTAGIGRSTAIGLAGLGAHVAVVGRDRERAEDLAREIRRAGGSADIFIADLSSQAQVRRLAAEALDRLDRIDVLINNAGGFWVTRHVTADGLERTFAVNHLAPFLLTSLLLRRLQESAPARVVTVASRAHTQGRIDFDDLQGERSYSGSRAYSQSKLAGILFTYELSRRLDSSTVTANAVHPGVVDTSFGADDPSMLQRVLVPVLRPFLKNADSGAATSIRVASAPELTHTSGGYFARGRPQKSSARSYDRATAARLWQVSARLVGMAGPDTSSSDPPRATLTPTEGS